PMNTVGTKSRTAIHEIPSVRPTASAAGRLRPARERRGAGSAAALLAAPVPAAAASGAVPGDPELPGAAGDAPPVGVPAGTARVGISVGTTPEGVPAAEASADAPAGAGVDSDMPSAGGCGRAAPVAAAFSATIVPSLNSSSFRSFPPEAGVAAPLFSLCVNPRAIGPPWRRRYGTAS